MLCYVMKNQFGVLNKLLRDAWNHYKKESGVTIPQLHKRTEVTNEHHLSGNTMPRGAQLVAAARRTNGNDDANVADDSRVELSQKVGDVTSVLNWEALAACQPQLSDSVLSWASAGESFALEDRNVMSAPWRRVFIVRDKGSNDYVLFDEKGRLIDEPLDGGVPGGRQTVDQLVSEFSVDGFYYKPPSLGRPSPAKRKRIAAAVEDNAIVQSECLTPLRSTLSESNEGANRSAAPARASPQCEDVLVCIAASEEQRATTPPRQPLTAATEVEAITTTADVEAVNVDELLSSIEECAGDASQSAGIEAAGARKPNTSVNPEAFEYRSDVAAAEDEVSRPDAAFPPSTAENADGVELCSPAAAECSEVSSPAAAEDVEVSPPAAENDDVIILASHRTTRLHGFEEWVGERVQLDGDDEGGTCVKAGMVAEANVNFVVVALDDGKWCHVPTASASQRLARSPNAPVELGVVGILIEKATGACGAWFGNSQDPEYVFGGSARAYLAYISKPCDRDTRLRRGMREANERSRKASFAYGDIVEQLNVPEGVRAVQAAVARIVYKERAGTVQARKMLILYEILSPSDVNTPQHPPKFFPASWSNWTRVHLVDKSAAGSVDDIDEGTENNATLPPQQMTKMEQVRKIRCSRRPM